MTGEQQTRPILRGTIDRVERTESGRRLAVVVLDDGQQLVVPIEAISPGAREGDAVVLRLEVDSGETARRKAHIQDLQKDLFGE